MPADNEPIEVFYADPVDENGNVIGTARLTITQAWGLPARAVKVPHSELAIEGLPTIVADLRDLQDEDR